MDIDIISEIKDEVKEIIPAQRYGIGGYLLSEDHGLDVRGSFKEIYIDGKVNLDVGYNCFIGNLKLKEILAKQNINSSLVKGADSKNYFGNHYFCVAEDNLILDSTPIYEFLGEEHTISDYVHQNRSFGINCINPWRLFSDSDNNYLLCYDVKFPFRPNEKPIIKPNQLLFSLRNTNLSTSNHCYVLFSLNMNLYKTNFDNDFLDILSKSDEAINVAIDSGTISIEDCYDRNYTKNSLEKILLNHDLIIAFSHKLVYGTNALK